MSILEDLQIELAAIEDEELMHHVVEAWRQIAPAKLRAAFDVV